MHFPNKELRAIAREQLTGHYILLISAVLCVILAYIGLVVVLSLCAVGLRGLAHDMVMFCGQILGVLLLSPVMASIYRIHLRIVRDNPVDLQDLWYVIRTEPDRYLTATILVAVRCALFFIPYAIVSVLVFQIIVTAPVSTVLEVITFGVGILGSLWMNIRYSMAIPILLDQPEVKPSEGLKLAVELLRGRRVQYLKLLGSFAGLLLLSVLTLQIGLLWVVPYLMSSQVMFYLDAEGQLEKLDESWKQKRRMDGRRVREP